MTEREDRVNEPLDESWGQCFSVQVLPQRLFDLSRGPRYCLDSIYPGLLDYFTLIPQFLRCAFTTYQRAVGLESQQASLVDWFQSCRTSSPRRGFPEGQPSRIFGLSLAKSKLVTMTMN